MATGQVRTLCVIVLAAHLAGVFNGGCTRQKKELSPLDSGALGDSDTGMGGGEDGGHCEDPGEGGPDTDVDADSDADTDADMDTDTDMDSGTDSGMDSSTDAGTDSDTDTSTIGECPEDMIYVPASSTTGVASPFCIDRFEASRRDATAIASGFDNTIACSESGVIPWYENPMTAEGFARFKDACNKAGKRICEREEWFGACTGEEMTSFVFGNSFNPETCNCVDTFCDDYCLENGIPNTECNSTSNCGYHCGHVEKDVICFKIAPTGSFPACTNSYGTYDMSGSLWEVVSSSTDPRGYEVRGGAFNCAGPLTRLRCDCNANWNTLYAGFRCCKDIGVAAPSPHFTKLYL